MSKHPAEATDSAGPVLLALARNAIAAQLDAELAAPQDDHALEATYPWLTQDGAAFVTLHVPGPDGRPRLRGCIGTIEAYRSLRADVQGNARAAAFRDPRFAPVSRDEYADLDIEVSVLSEREPLPYPDRAELVRQLRPGVDGVVLEYAGRRGTYLPQVWEQIPDPSDFLASLVTKAHLPPGFWRDDIAIWRYTVTPYAESG